MAEEDKASLTARFFSITTWKQVMITIVLGGFVLIAWLIYMNQGRVVAAMEELVRRAPRITVNQSAIPEVTKQLLEMSGVVSVTVWSADMESNRRWLLGWAAIEPAQSFLKKWEARLQVGYPLFRTTAGANLLMVEALNGGVGCGPLGGPDTEVAVLHSVGVKWECVAGIPPEVGTFSGVLFIGFNQELSKDTAETLSAPIWSAASQLAQ
jgi:hypothetical protein